MINKVRNFHRRAVVVSAIRWGPTWEQMQTAAKWLGESGVFFRFESNQGFAPTTDMGLPALILYRQWDGYNVRVGDWLVKTAHGEVTVVPREEFKRDYVLIGEGE